jgi:disulfide bond formation protein DsbB
MFFAIVYPVVGVVFAFAASQGMVVFWRLAAWLVCLVTFAVHLWYEHFRLQSPPYKAALRVSLAVALGAFLLAVWINVHAHWSAAGPPNPFALLSLFLFPVITGVPALVVAMIVASLLPRAGQRTEGR